MTSSVQPDNRQALMEHVAQRLWFEFVDSHGYPNGLPTWGELMEMAKTDPRCKHDVTLYLSMALGAIEVIEHFSASAAE